MEAECGRQDGSPSGTGCDFLEGWIWLWYFWRHTAWPGQCLLVTERVLPLSEQTSIHLPMPALSNAFSSAVEWDWREGAATVRPKGHLHHFSKKTTDGISKCITGCTGLPWKALGRTGVWRSSLERTGGQGRVRGGVVSSKVSPSAPLRRRGSNMRHRSLWPSHPALACL